MPAPLQLFSFCSPRPATVSAEQDAQNCRDSPAALDARYPAPTTIPLSALEHIIERKSLFGEPFLQNAAEAFKKVARDELTVAPVQCLGKHSLGRPLAGNADGQCCIKTGYLGGAGGAGAADEEEIFVVKAAGRGALGPTGAMLAFSQKTVQLKTILLDDGMLTSIRTAAAACMASRHFLKRLGYAVLQDGVKTEGRREITKIGLVGGGSQALWNLRFLTYVTSCRDVVLLTRSRESAERFAETLKNSACLLDRAWNVEVCDEGCREKLRECQVQGIVFSVHHASWGHRSFGQPKRYCLSSRIFLARRPLPSALAHAPAPARKTIF